jgi:mono/diheme cytochrome c family protein
MLVGIAVSVTLVNGRAFGQSATVKKSIEGEELFRSYCAACHGRDGKGGGPAAPALKTPPADLTSIARRNGGAFPRDRVIQYVANGEPSTPAHGSREMPIWGANFTALAPPSFKPVSERIEAVVAYVESIQFQPK